MIRSQKLTKLCFLRQNGRYFELYVIVYKIGKTLSKKNNLISKSNNIYSGNLALKTML